MTDMTGEPILEGEQARQAFESDVAGLRRNNFYRRQALIHKIDAIAFDVLMLMAAQK